MKFVSLFLFLLESIGAGMTTENTANPAPETGRNFIRQIVDEDLKNNKNDGKVVTRFPPEPNGFLHLGHAKSICLNFGLAKEHRGICHLRFDDTDPAKESMDYVESIQNDVKWLGFDWGTNLFFASDYFDILYKYALELIETGKAYVDDSSAEEIRAMRGTLTEPGVESPYRNRSVAENQALFAKMYRGEFPEGSHVLRAKIDMASPNIVLRDPVIYRIKNAHHYRSGNKWHIYPMYDFTHCLSDATEGITHSICTLEFEINRPLYDWVLDNVAAPCHPRQIEFAKLQISNTVLSKRRLLRLVQSGVVSGWDDPRMPTIAGMRRRGYTPASIRNFADRIGVAKSDSLVDMALLEFCVREDLNRTALRVMGVLNPLKVIIDNYPERQNEELEAVNNPEDAAAGSRKVTFSREIYIERDDFMEDPPKKFFRLSVGREVRLRYAYFITCTGFDKDPVTGEITALHCTYDPESKGGNAPNGRKVKSTIHWVDANNYVNAAVNLYDRLFTREDMTVLEEGKEFTDYLNPVSLTVITNAVLEKSLADAKPDTPCQFERLGYFVLDPDSKPDAPVFNRTVGLKDSWAKIAAKG